MAISVQISLLHWNDEFRKSESAINAVPGIWAALAGALTASLSFVSVYKPTTCTLSTR